MSPRSLSEVLNEFPPGMFPEFAARIPSEIFLGFLAKIQPGMPIGISHGISSKIPGIIPTFCQEFLQR